MIFWYRNSVLASLVSIIGCVIVITGIAGLRDREIGVGPGILVIVAGIGIAALGKVISDRKAQKKTEQARTAQPGEKQEVQLVIQKIQDMQKEAHHRMPGTQKRLKIRIRNLKKSSDRQKVMQKKKSITKSWRLFCPDYL